MITAFTTSVCQFVQFVLAKLQTALASVRSVCLLGLTSRQTRTHAQPPAIHTTKNTNAPDKLNCTLTAPNRSTAPNQTKGHTGQKETEK